MSKKILVMSLILTVFIVSAAFGQDLDDDVLAERANVEAEAFEEASGNGEMEENDESNFSSGEQPRAGGTAEGQGANGLNSRFQRDGKSHGQSSSSVQKRRDKLVAKGMAKDGGALPVKGFHWQGASSIALTRIKVPSRAGGEDEDRVGFSLGELDVLISKSVNPKLELFSEVRFKWSEKNNAGLAEVDRLWLDYSFANWFAIRAGRFHRALGYRSGLDFHGSQTLVSVSQPIPYEAAGESGTLPLHGTGVEFHGGERTSSFASGYHLSVTNGRGEAVAKQQVSSDADLEKAYTAAFYIGAPKWGGFRIGGSYHAGTLPGLDTNIDDVPDQGLGREVISGVNLGFHMKHWHFIAEGFNISHDFRTGETRSQYKVFYSQIAVFFLRQALLFRYGIIDPELGVKLQDPYYLDQVAGQQISRGTLGWRLQWDQDLQLKLELQASTYKKDDLTDEKGTLNISYFW